MSMRTGCGVSSSSWLMPMTVCPRKPSMKMMSMGEAWETPAGSAGKRESGMDGCKMVSSWRVVSNWRMAPGRGHAKTRSEKQAMWKCVTCCVAQEKIHDYQDIIDR